MDRRWDRWSRRQFVLGASGLALVAGCERLPWQAQPPARIPRIAYLEASNASAQPLEAFREGLRALGYVEGQNLLIEARWADGRSERFPALAALVRLQPDVMVTGGTPPTQAAMQVTDSIPIVFTNIADPVGLGIVAGLAGPAGNVTGLSNLFGGLSGKRLELLMETVPGAVQVVALLEPTNPASALDWSATQEAARTLGVEVRPVEVRTADELDSAWAAIARERADALIMLAGPVFSVNNTPQLADFIARSRLPTMNPTRANVEAGGLMSYGPNFLAMHRRAAYYVDRILKGTKPADLPVEQPMTFDFVVNLKTAAALGITFPNEIMLQVTEVIQ